VTAAPCRHDLDPSTCSVCNGTDLLQGHLPGRGRPSNTEALVDAMFEWIPEDGQDWISRDDLADLSGLTPEQVSRAVAWLRDNAPEFPLVSSTYGYRFSMDQADVNAYRAARAKTAYTQIRRTWTGVVRPYVEQTQDPTMVRSMTRQFERLLEDIADLIR
jgi:hypothetical protein